MNSFPDNKKFAFTIFDDTDFSTVQNTAPVYRLLTELGMRTTKSVWPLASVAEGKCSGCSLQDPDYLRFVLELQKTGFEIALHGMRNHHCSRPMIEQGFSEFVRLTGRGPRAHANHSRNRENLYWGAARFNALKQLYSAGAYFAGDRKFSGHVPGADNFWGDLCCERLDYVRGFVFREINLDRVNPTMPYRDPRRPLVKRWFSSCDGADAASFCDLLAEPNQEQLEAERGVCIVYAHMACGFVENGQVHPRVEQLLRALSKRNGWFVPVSTLLDYLLEQRHPGAIPSKEFFAMERRWAKDRILSAVKRVVRTGFTSSRQSHSRLVEREQETPIRVTHITSAHSAFDSRIFHKECRSLAKAGYKVTLLGAFSSGTEARDGVTVRGLGRSRARWHRMSAKLMQLCREAFRENSHVYQIHDPELLFVALLLRAAGKNVIYDIHEDLPRTVHYKNYIPRRMRDPLLQVIEKAENFLAKRMTGLIAATPTIERRFHQFHSHTVVVNNFPLNEEALWTREGNWEERDKAVAYIGRIAHERGIREVLRAVSLLRDLDIHLELAGTFSSAELKAELSAQPEWNQVRWHGMLDRRDVYSLLNRVRVGLVILHPEQNFVYSHPIKLFEYMGAGIPVIASDFPLWRSIVEGSGCGLLVDPLNPPAIAEAIRNLVNDSVLAEEMGKRGRKTVEERYNWRAEEGKLLSFYKSILSPFSVPAAEPVALTTLQETR